MMQLRFVSVHVGSAHMRKTAPCASVSLEVEHEHAPTDPEALQKLLQRQSSSGIEAKGYELLAAASAGRMLEKLRASKHTVDELGIQIQVCAPMLSGLYVCRARVCEQQRGRMIGLLGTQQGKREHMQQLQHPCSQPVGRTRACNADVWHAGAARGCGVAHAAAAAARGAVAAARGRAGAHHAHQRRH